MINHQKSNIKKQMINKILFLLLLTLVIFGCSSNPKGELLFVESNSEKGFNYPYFLFIPEETSLNKKLVLIIEPNNSGFADDDINRHISKAERTASKDFYTGNYVAQALNYPLLVPVFPRSKTNWKIYTHALDRDVVCEKDSQLERIDLQLLAMVDDAKIRLTESGYSIRDKFLMTGFSASGTFVNRFTLIHPDKVLAAAAGGLNGLLALPIDSLNNKALNYPLGINDFKIIFNIDFQKNEFKNTPQFYFMGGLDDNDAVLYDDAYDQNERELIFELIGEEMIPLRWESSKKIYLNEGVNSVIETYEDIGHEQPESVKKYIINFFQENINL